MKKTLLLFAIVLLSHLLKAQETAVAIFAATDKIMTQLTDLEQQIGGTIATSINQLSQNLTGHEQQLKQILGSQITEPIQNLNINVQNQVRLFQNIVNNVSQLLTWQIQCIFRNADIFKASLSTAASQIESNIRFIGKKGDPLVYSVSFDGRPNFVVPLSGGRLTIKGYLLYDDYAPLVKIYNEKRVLLMDNIPVIRAGSNNDVSIYIDGSFVNRNQGNLIYFEVTPRKSRWLIGGPENLNPVNIPLKIPAVTNVSYRIQGFVDYKWINNITFEMKDQVWANEEHNANCGETRAANGSHSWNICSDCKILNVMGGATQQRYMNDGGNIVWSVPNTNTIAYAGTIGRPRCGVIAFIRHLFSDAYYKFIVWPQVQQTVYTEEQKTNFSTGFILDDTQKNIIINIPINSNPRRETVFWYQINEIDNGTETTIYTSSRFNSDDNGVSADTYTKKDGYKFDASLNNKTINSSAQVAIKITVPPPCASF